MITTEIHHYRILEELGRGGMGVVYKARDTRLDRFVALKFLSPHLSQDDAGQQRFIHEAKAASALDHPNICTIHEIDETRDKQMFIAMAYYEGESLKERIGNGPLPIAEAIEITTQIASGLSRAHEEHIIHRDVTPANIMITDRREVKILDFGLAKLSGISPLTKEGATLGTVAYMSPEQAQAVEIDHRTDIWALGVVLYEMLTGQLPFKGEHDQILLYSIVNEELEPVTTLRPDVPAELREIVNKMLAKDANERYENLEDVISDLTAICKPTAGSAKAIPPTVNRRRVSRKIFYSGLAALLLLLTLGAIYLSRILNSDESKTTGVNLRIAVLPFANISQDPDDEYFTDGMTEELISTLSQISGLHVIARTSVMRYKNTTKSIAEIGQELQVGTVLEGSVRQAENKLRITVQLVDSKSQEQLWSHDYDRDLLDVFAIQSDIAQQVAVALELEFLAEEKRRIEKKTTENLEAYNLYLKGRYHWNTLSEHGLRKALEYFERAIEKDPNYALAYSGLADTYAMLGVRGDILPDEAGSKMKRAASKALEIDDTLARAYTNLADYKQLHERDWSGAEKVYRRAIRLNSNDPWAHFGYGGLLQIQGRHDESVRQRKRALALDPLSLLINSGMGHTFRRAGRYEEAIEQYQTTLELYPNVPQAHWGLGRIFEEKGMIEEAIKAFQKGLAASTKGSPRLKAALGYVYARSDREIEARQIITELEDQSNYARFPSFEIGIIYLGLGDKDQAFPWFERAYEEGHKGLLGIKHDERFRDVRDDPRYRALLKKMGLDKS